MRRKDGFLLVTSIINTHFLNETVKSV